MSSHIKFKGKLYQPVVGCASVIGEPVEVVEKPEPKPPAMIRVPCPHADVLDRHEAHCECLGDGFVLRPSPPSLGAREAQEFLDRCQYFYGQCGGGFKWPNSREGDLLRMGHKALAALPELEARPCTFCLNKRSAERCSQCNGTGEVFVKVRA